MEGPEKKVDVVARSAARKQRLRSWARCTLWVAGTSLILLDCGMHALITAPAFDGDTVRFDRELRNGASAAQSAPGSIAERDSDLYLPPLLRSGSFE